MTLPLVACLTVTNRPRWEPFVRWQFEKQTWPRKRHIIVAQAGATIAELRTQALLEAELCGADYVAWFDDDDWAHENRILTGACALASQGSLAAVGSVAAWFISTETRRGIRYQAPEGIVFNGAVFRRKLVPRDFSGALTTGEDTEWLARWQHMNPSYMIVGEPMHAWLCHRGNITNRSDSRTFLDNPPKLMTQKDWELVP